MNRWLALALILVLLRASRTQADIPPFHHDRPYGQMAVPPSNAVPVVIQASAKEGRSRLIVPRALLERAKKEAPPPKRFGVLGLPIPFVAMGIVSSAGLGLVCFRGHRWMRTALMIVALFAAAGTGVPLLEANAAPLMGLESQKIAVPIPNGEELKLEGVRVEIADEGDAIRLIVPQATLASWTKANKKNP